jgi:hypothetical protein
MTPPTASRRRNSKIRSLAGRALLVGGLIVGEAVTSTLPAAAVEKCNVRGYGIDPDPFGLNVRNTSSKSGRVVGKLFSSSDEETGQMTGPWFTITGYANRWVRMRDADAKTIGVDTAKEKVNYQGAGWVSADRVTVSLSTPTDETYFTKREHKSYSKPSFQASVVEDWASTNARLQYDNLGSDPLIVGCSGRWVKLVYRISGYIDRTGEWTSYETSDPEFGRPITAWLYGENN